MKPALMSALPKHLTADRFLRVALTELRGNPKLMQCDQMSFLRSVMFCAQLGLEPGGVLGHCYLLPFENRKKGITECQFILGYKGMLNLTRRSGEISSITSHTVHADDTFEFEFGLDEKLVHIPSLSQPRTKDNMVGVYAIAKFVGGGYQMDFMSSAEVEDIKSRSKASSFGPWVTDYLEMAKKTAIRRIFKYLPVSIEALTAASLDEAADRGEQKIELDNVFSPVMESLEHQVDPETGEITPAEAALKSAADKLADKIEG